MEELRRFIGLIDGLELSTFDPAQKEEPAQPPAGLRFWDDVLREVDDAFAAPLHALKTVFQWSTFYKESDWSRPFFANFAAGKIVGPGCVVQSDDLIIGVVLMGPHTFYPAHAPPAVEVYTALAGKPHFRADGGTWRVLEDGAFAFHPADMPHTMKTDERPMLALYAWRGDITAPSYGWEEGRKVYPPKVQ